MTVILVRECVHLARCLPIEAFKEGNCCIAKTFNYNKRYDISMVARFRVLILAAMST